MQKAFFKHALGSSVESNERILFYRIFLVNQINLLL